METLLRIFTYSNEDINACFKNITAGNNTKIDSPRRMGYNNRNLKSNNLHGIAFDGLLAIHWLMAIKMNISQFKTLHN